jgi:hypothetical protein
MSSVFSPTLVVFFAWLPEIDARRFLDLATGPSSLELDSSGMHLARLRFVPADIVTVADAAVDLAVGTLTPLVC